MTDSVQQPLADESPNVESQLDQKPTRRQLSPLHRRLSSLQKFVADWHTDILEGGSASREKLDQAYAEFNVFTEGFRAMIRECTTIRERNELRIILNIANNLIRLLLPREEVNTNLRTFEPESEFPEMVQCLMNLVRFMDQFRMQFRGGLAVLS